MKINYKNTMLVGLAFLTISAFWQLYEFFVPLILKNTFDVSDTVSGFIMSADNVVALILLPIFGMMSDRTRARMGRRKPYIIGGTIAAVATMMLIPFAVQEQRLIFFMVILGFVLIFMATYRSPAVALMPDITPKPLRSKGNAVINLMGALGAAIILLLIWAADKIEFLNESEKDWMLFGITAAIMVIGMLIVVFFVNEPKLSAKMRKDSAAMGIEDEEEATSDTKKAKVKTKLQSGVRRSMMLILLSISLWYMGYNAITTAFSKYSVNYLGMEEGEAALILMVAVIVATISFIPVGIISSKVGRKKSIIFGIVVLTGVFATSALYTEFSPLMYVSFSLAGVAWASINVNSLPMVLEMSKNANVGQYTGYYYTFSMAAQVVTPILSGVLLQHVGYFTLFPYAAVFVALALITMVFVRHGDSKPMAVSKIESLGAGD